MKNLKWVLILGFVIVFLGGCGMSGVKNVQQPAVTLRVSGAGTLSGPFKKINEEFMKKYPEVKIEDQYGGSVKMIKQITELKEPTDFIAVADYETIPQLMFAKNGGESYADWYISFAGNAMTFVYTDQSKGQDQLTPDNWFQILAQPGIQIARSNPNTDPSGYQAILLLQLAEKYYQKPQLAQQIMINSPDTNIRDSGSELISALKSGQIDYVAAYKSVAVQNHLKYIEMPVEINVSDPQFRDQYKTVSVDTKNGKVLGKPIVYGFTIPSNAEHPEWAAKYAAFILSDEGQKIMQESGFTVLPKNYASNIDKVPNELQPLVIGWPQE